MDVSDFYFACPVCMYDDPAKECTFFVRNEAGHPVRMATSADFRAVLRPRYSGGSQTNDANFRPVSDKNTDMIDVDTDMIDAD